MSTTLAARRKIRRGSNAGQVEEIRDMFLEGGEEHFNRTLKTNLYGHFNMRCSHSARQPCS